MSGGECSTGILACVGGVAVVGVSVTQYSHEKINWRVKIMFGGFGDFKAILEQAKSMQENVAKMKKELECKEVEGASGAGLVTVQVSGTGHLKSLTIDKSVVDPNDVGMLQDLILSAVNDGVKKSKELLKEEMAKLTGGMPIPPGFDNL